MKLAEAITYMGAAAPDIDPALAQREVSSFVVDSREVKAGDVFFALSQPEYRNNGFNGDFDDATVFAAGALENGAVITVLRPDRFEEHRTELDRFRPQLAYSSDVIGSMQALAREVYSRWGKPVIAITGSAGKTTAKEITAHILEHGGRKVLRNIKNYNNGIGHPLTVLEIAKNDSYDVAVLEMGMSTPMNEIARLCSITPPDVAVELNVLPVHLEHLGSIENIAKAKGELVEGMKPGGTAVLNSDDPHVLAMRSLASGDTITYGLGTAADVMAENVEFRGFGETFFDLRTPSGSASLRFPLNGRHNIMNALAAAGAALSVGMRSAEIAAALETVPTPAQRGEIVRFAQGFTVINDSYNSNPTALISMVETVAAGRGKANRLIVVAGEMLELGETAAASHRETGAAIAGKGIDLLIGVRGNADALVEGAREAGLAAARFVEDSAAAGRVLVDEVRPGDIVLIKGSRGVRTEKVLETLMEKYEPEAKGAANG